QAELLAKKFGFIHFDTGRYFEALLHSPETQKNPVLRRERKNFDNGILLSPSWVLKVVAKATERIAKAGLNIVYSGSPRTLYEAFGKNNDGLFKILEKHYGKKNITVIKLNVRGGTSLRRNSRRLVCAVCGLPVLAEAKAKKCSFCSGPLKKRTLDKPEVIKIRLKEYENRTYPILAKAKKGGFKVKTVDGEPEPYKVFERVQGACGLN
ncbi:MAG: nucleoside monophosphate kinase, partial [Patescibacteria group bacterium]